MEPGDGGQTRAWDAQGEGVGALRTQENGVRFLARLEGRGREGLADGVDGASSKLVLLELDLDVAGGGGDRFEDAHGFGDDLRAWN